MFAKTSGTILRHLRNAAHAAGAGGGERGGAVGGRGAAAGGRSTPCSVTAWCPGAVEDTMATGSKSTAAPGSLRFRRDPGGCSYGLS